MNPAVDRNMPSNADIQQQPWPESLSAAGRATYVRCCLDRAELEGRLAVLGEAREAIVLESGVADDVVGGCDVLVEVLVTVLGRIVLRRGTKAVAHHETSEEALRAELQAVRHS